MRQNLDARLDFDQSGLGSGQRGPTGEEEAGQGLAVSTAEATSRHEGRYFRLHSLHP